MVIGALAANHSGAYISRATTDHALVTRTVDETLLLDLIDIQTGTRETILRLAISPPPDAGRVPAAAGTRVVVGISPAPNPLVLSPNRRAAILQVSAEQLDAQGTYMGTTIDHYYVDFDHRSATRLPRISDLGYFGYKNMGWSMDSRHVLINFSPPEYQDYYRQDIFRLDAISLAIEQVSQRKAPLYFYGWLDGHNVLVLEDNYNYDMWRIDARQGVVYDFEEADFDYERLTSFDSPPLPNGTYTTLARANPIGETPPPQPTITVENPYTDGATFFTPDYAYRVDLNFSARATTFTVETPRAELLTATETGYMTVLGWASNSDLLMYRTSSNGSRGFVFVYDLATNDLSMVADAARSSATFSYGGCVYAWDNVVAPGWIIPCNPTGNVVEVVAADAPDPTGQAVSESSFRLEEGALLVREFQDESGDFYRRLYWAVAGNEHDYGQIDQLWAIVAAGEPQPSHTPLLLGMALMGVGSTRLLRKNPRW